MNSVQYTLIGLLTGCAQSFTLVSEMRKFVKVNVWSDSVCITVIAVTKWWLYPYQLKIIEHYRGPISIHSMLNNYCQKQN